MQHYGNGYDLEDAIFGRHSSGSKLAAKFHGKLSGFAEDVLEVINSLDIKNVEHPKTKIGQALHHQVARELCRLGVDPEGLVFLSAVDTKADLYGVDGLFFLPSLFPHLVTIDAFNLAPEELVSLRERWIDSFAGQFYSETDFQSDLFRYKYGKMKWRADNEKAQEAEFILDEPIDFRFYANHGRHENDFIATPKDLGTYESRRSFAKLVAGYFAKVAKMSSHENMALLSH